MLEQKGAGCRNKAEGGSKCGVVGSYTEGKEGDRRLVQKRVYMVCLQPIGREFVQKRRLKMLEKGGA